MKKIKIWKTVCQYVHLETGEVLTKYEAEKNYIILKKTKHVRINNENKSATIFYVYECTRTGSQTRLWTPPETKYDRNKILKFYNEKTESFENLEKYQTTYPKITKAVYGQLNIYFLPVL